MITAYYSLETRTSKNPVGLVCRDVRSGEVFVKVGTEALRKGTEVIAVAVDGVLTMTRPDLDPALVTFNVKDAVASAVFAGRTLSERRYLATRQQLDHLAGLLHMGVRSMDERYSLADTVASTLSMMLNDEAAVLDEDWARARFGTARMYGREGSAAVRQAGFDLIDRFGS